ncbi:MAG: hypothetical protein ACFB21_10000 [Opitutales bacterium]
MNSRSLNFVLGGLALLFAGFAAAGFLRSPEAGATEADALRSRIDALEAELDRAETALAQRDKQIEELDAARSEDISRRIALEAELDNVDERLRQRRTLATAEPEEAVEDDESSEGARIMRDFGEMMDNPQMNKMMVASQRAALEVLYEDLIVDFAFNEEEQAHFLDLLLQRQMANMELGMKLAAGGLSSEERRELALQLNAITSEVKEEIDFFLNSEEDAAAFDHFEQTMQDRMQVVGVEQQLAAVGVPLAEGQNRELIDLMWETRQNFDFSTNLHDAENADVSAERLSRANLDRHFADMERLNASILERAADMLTHEQLAVFEQTQAQTLRMQRSQMEMAAQMFGGGQ